MSKPSLRINIEVIPHSEMRYDTCGDYFKDQDGVWQFRISDMHNRAYEMLVLLHELTEWFMCQAVGIRVEDIDRFDMRFERDRIRGLHNLTEEPGDHPDAPYRHQHKCATRLERLAAKLFGVRWSIYNSVVENL